MNYFVLVAGVLFTAGAVQAIVQGKISLAIVYFAYAVADFAVCYIDWRME